MKCFTIVLAVCVALFMGFAGPALAQDAGVTRFEQSISRNWFVDGNWDNHVPTATMHAIIKADKECRIPIDRTDAVAKKITIRAGDTSLWLRKGSVLTLGVRDEEHTSTIKSGGRLEIGEVNHRPGAILEIAGDHTIIGDGGVIDLREKAQINDNDDSDDELTITGTESCNEACDKVSRPDRDCSLVVTGEGIINVKLYNDAFVVGGEDDALTLAQADKDSGCCGSWIAEDGGFLVFECDVFGSGTWRSERTADPKHTGGQFLINACVQATGPVIITDGTAGEYVNTAMIVASDAHFCSEGNLELRSITVGEVTTAPRIEVLGQWPSAAVFGTNCAPANCP